MKKIISFIVVALVFIAEAVYFDYVTMPDAFCEDNWWRTMYILSKCSISLLMASVILISKRIWVPLMVVIISKIWIVCNLIYYRAYQLFITWQIIRIAGNLRGFENSVLVYIDPAFWWLLSFSLLSIIALIVGYWQAQNHRYWIAFACVVVLSLGMSATSAVCRYHYYKNNINPDGQIEITWFHPFQIPKELTQETWKDDTYNIYMIYHSIHASLFRAVYEPVWHSLAGDMIVWTDEEKDLLHQLISQPVTANKPTSHLVFILVESLTTEGIEMTDIYGNPVTPHLRQLIHQDHVLYAPNMRSQRMYGLSGDGLLITQTGLLPLTEGVSCMEFGANTYPNFAHFYDNSYLINPAPNSWNQGVTTYAYGYQHLIEPANTHHWNDSIVFAVAKDVCQQLTTPSCVAILTISTHLPFDGAPETMTLHDSIPWDDNDYFQCLHYADRCIGDFIAYLDTAATMKDATLVVTSDHNILYGSYRIPLIVRGTNVPNLIRTDTTYQCDVFPTVLHTISQDNYFWKGFGINLSDTTQVRVVSPTLYSLSDKLIRKNYFK